MKIVENNPCNSQAFCYLLCVASNHGTQKKMKNTTATATSATAATAATAAAHIERHTKWAAEYAATPTVTVRGTRYHVRPWLAEAIKTRPHLTKVVADAIKRPYGRRYARLVRAIGDHGAYCAVREA